MARNNIISTCILMLAVLFISAGSHNCEAAGRKLLQTIPGLPNIPTIPTIPTPGDIPQIPTIPTVPNGPNVGLPVPIPNIPYIPRIPYISGTPFLSPPPSN
ncbi:hypothetical protein ACH5RR_038169 [Cinchona calisaya]|uniref:Uncharacterized protein n=1 Tax=Cinchona calisaya TaxID=153742 RepID=A0ABD2Y9D4_9GENT